MKRWGDYLGRDAYFTDSMRRTYYHDQPETYQMFCPQEVVNARVQGNRDILFVSHELSLTGAPILLMDAVQTSIANGDFPVVMSPADGPLRKNLVEMGVTVIVDAGIETGSILFQRFARNFDLVIVNTLVLAQAIRVLSDDLPPVLWWIHDGIEVLENIEKLLPQKLGKNIHIFCASEYSQRLLLPYGRDYSSEILRCGVCDAANFEAEYQEEENRLKFLIIGSLERRKGQDILLKAIDILLEAYQKRAEFLIIGRKLQSEIKELIDKYALKYPCIRYIGVMSRAKVFDFYPQSICAIIPSRDEPTSMIAIESMMFSRTVIASDMVGIGEFITDGRDGFIFHNENFVELAEKIKYVIDHCDEVLKMGHEARSIYEKHYKLDLFNKRYIQIIDELTETN